MSDLEQKLASVMNDPSMMQQIMALAQSLDTGAQPNPAETQEKTQAFPDIDVSMLQKLSGFTRQSGIDKNQKALLQALRPYLSGQRINRLERAMQAAKMASFATSLLGR